MRHFVLLWKESLHMKVYMQLWGTILPQMHEQRALEIKMCGAFSWSAYLNPWIMLRNLQQINFGKIRSLASYNAVSEQKVKSSRRMRHFRTNTIASYRTGWLVRDWSGLRVSVYPIDKSIYCCTFISTAQCVEASALIQVLSDFDAFHDIKKSWGLHSIANMDRWIACEWPNYVVASEISMHLTKLCSLEDPWNGWSAQTISGWVCHLNGHSQSNLSLLYRSLAS